jgi:hypothetical protein
VSTLVMVEYVSLDGVVQAPGYNGEDPDGGFAHGGWTGPFMAERLGSDAVEFPGDHQGFATHPGPFAETVHQVLRGS